jgi:hypothetical protein
MSFSDSIGESRSFDKLRMTGLQPCPVLDTVKLNDEVLRYEQFLKEVVIIS